MTTFAQVRAGRVLAHFVKDCTLADAKAMFADIAPELHEAPSNVQDGWDHVGGLVFAPHTESTEERRQREVDAAISGDTTLAQLKAMSNAEFDVWWTANVSNAQQAIQVLKRLARLVIRRVL